MSFQLLKISNKDVLLYGGLEMKYTYKILLFSMLFFAVNSLDANLRQNNKTGMYYSQGARKNVDPIEYHNLVMQWMYFSNMNPGYNVDGLTCIELKKIGTHAALRLIHDIKKLYNNSK